MKFRDDPTGRRKRHHRLIGSIILFVLLLSNKAASQVDPWELEVYPYATEARGMAEFETGNAVVAKGHSTGGSGTSSGTFPSEAMWYQQFEIDYGVTDRVEADVMLDVALPRSQGYWYAGSKYSLRGKLLDEGSSPVELGWYAELGGERLLSTTVTSYSSICGRSSKRIWIASRSYLIRNSKRPSSWDRTRIKDSNSATPLACTSSGFVSFRRASNSTAASASSTTVNLSNNNSTTSSLCCAANCPRASNIAWVRALG